MDEDTGARRWYDPIVDGLTIRQEDEDRAWEAFTAARGDWARRGAPSVGARARSLLNLWLASYPLRRLDASHAALKLYLSRQQTAERAGFQAPRGRLAL